MSSLMPELAREMREAGVRRVSFQENSHYAQRYGIQEMELSDTIPAPPPFDGELDSEPDKPPGTCIALGCTEPGGWHFDRRYCGPHGRSAAGVKP